MGLINLRYTIWGFKAFLVLWAAKRIVLQKKKKRLNTLHWYWKSFNLITQQPQFFNSTDLDSSQKLQGPTARGLNCVTEKKLKSYNVLENQADTKGPAMAKFSTKVIVLIPEKQTSWKYCSKRAIHNQETFLRTYKLVPLLNFPITKKQTTKIPEKMKRKREKRWFLS